MARAAIGCSLWRNRTCEGLSRFFPTMKCGPYASLSTDDMLVCAVRVDGALPALEFRPPLSIKRCSSKDSIDSVSLVLVCILVQKNIREESEDALQ